MSARIVCHPHHLEQKRLPCGQIIALLTNKQGAELSLAFKENYLNNKHRTAGACEQNIFLL